MSDLEYLAWLVIAGLVLSLLHLIGRVNFCLFCDAPSGRWRLICKRCRRERGIR